jgi:membrane-associated phospholipid phosphatase
MPAERRLAFALLLPLVACGQLWAALELVGIALHPPGLVFGLEGACIVGSVIYAWKTRPAAEEPRELSRWWLVGGGVFLVWAVLYFTAGRVTDAGNARTFDDSILARVPLMPAFAPIYLGVHVFGVLPFCVIPEVRLLRRHLLGAVLIVVLSSVVWVALPVRVDRPPIDPALTGFGAWLLRGVYSFDPTTNCFPSAHCAIAVYAAIGLRFSSRLLFRWGVATALLVCLSTVLTHQHYVADVVSGALLAALCGYGTLVRRRPTLAHEHKP